MYARRQIDIAWSDLLFALSRSIFGFDADPDREALSKLYPSTHNFLATLSVRTALDLLLSALKLPSGSEVLISAVTIKDMVTIIEAHGLVPVPVDLNLETLEPRLDLAQQQISDRTKLFLVAPLYGTRFSMAPIVEFANLHNLFLVEDLAQAFCGDLLIADARSDAVLFSFGPIKTATTLGGALCGVKDHKLFGKLLELEAEFPAQTRLDYFSKLFKFCVIKVLTWPVLYGLFVKLTGVLGRDYDALIAGWTRGFKPGELLPKIRRRPTVALLALLERRLSQITASSFVARVAVAQQMAILLESLTLPGSKNSSNTYWVFPVCVADPQGLCAHLRSAGFDATRGASNLLCVGASDDTRYLAQEMLQRVVYLPVYPDVPSAELKRLARITLEFVQR